MLATAVNQKDIFNTRIPLINVEVFKEFPRLLTHKIMCTDSLTRYLASIISPLSMIRVFADDTAIVLHDLWKEGPIVAVAFEYIQVITALTLNGKKCILVPLFVD